MASEYRMEFVAVASSKPNLRVCMPYEDASTIYYEVTKLVGRRVNSNALTAFLDGLNTWLEDVVGEEDESE